MTFARLSEEALATITSGHCPQCSYRGFVIGPGVFPTAPRPPELEHIPPMFQINIECGNPVCRSRFDVTFISGRAMMGTDLFDGRTSIPWPSEPKDPAA